MAFQKGLRVKRLGRLLHQHGAFFGLGLFVGIKILADRIGFQTHRIGVFLQLTRRALGKGQKLLGAQIHHAAKPVARARWPKQRRGIKRQL